MPESPGWDFGVLTLLRDPNPRPCGAELVPPWSGAGTGASSMPRADLPAEVWSRLCAPLRQVTVLELILIPSAQQGHLARQLDRRTDGHLVAAAGPAASAPALPLQATSATSGTRASLTLINTEL